MNPVLKHLLRNEFKNNCFFLALAYYIHMSE